MGLLEALCPARMGAVYTDLPTEAALLLRAFIQSMTYWHNHAGSVRIQAAPSSGRPIAIHQKPRCRSTVPGKV